jgi:hypothetical protein
MAPTKKLCQPAFVFCGEDSSTCFSDLDVAMGSGWSIDVASAIGFEAGTRGKITCDVVMGATDCDISKGTKVGTFKMSSVGVKWSFVSGYGGLEFQLYTGDCEYNDGGASLTNGGVCTKSNMIANAAAPDNYTMVSPTYDDTYWETFYFNEGNVETFLKANSWGANGFEPFPIGASGRQYLSAHAMVCPCEFLGVNCRKF